MVVGYLGQSPDVTERCIGIADRFNEERFGVRSDRLRNLLQIAGSTNVVEIPTRRRCERRGYRFRRRSSAETMWSPCFASARIAIDRRHSTGNCQRPTPSNAATALERILSRIVQSGVDVSRAPEGEALLGIGRIVKDERGGLVDRHSPRAGRRFRLFLACM